MMSPKMISFLTNKLKIEDISEFDFNFGTITKNQSTNVFNMQIIKDTPWTFDLLDYFVAHWPVSDFELSFAYKIQITGKHVLSLFKEMYVAKYHKNPNASFEIQDNVILFRAENDEIKITKLVSDFESLLKQINYPRFRILKDETENIEVLQTFSPSEEENEENNLEEYNREIFEEPNEFEEFDFEKEAESLVFTDSKKFYEESKYMEKRLEGLDTSRRYHDVEINQMTGENLNVVCDAEIFSVETKDMRNGKKRYTIGLHDESGSIFAQAVEGKEFSAEFLNELKPNINVRFTGYTLKDKFLNNELIVKLTSIIITGKKGLREDNAPEKRVELHLHTKMSQMDGVSEIDDYCKLAKAMGHKAIAITDHGVVQGFPAAQQAAKKHGIKMLYGAELYVVEDEFTAVLNPNDEKLADATYCVLDFESTGLSTRYDKIIEFGAVKLKNGIILDRIDMLINPGEKLPRKIVEITGITDAMLRNQPTIDEAIDKIMEFIGDSVIVSHNLEFDFGLLNTALQQTRGVELVNAGVDTLSLSRYLNPEFLAHRLGNLCRRNDVFYDEDAAHRADYDAEVLAKCWTAMISTLTNRGLHTISSIHKFKKETEHIKHSYEMHTTVLAKNRKGLKALYKLISLSHIQYLGRYPCVPKIF